MVLRVGWRTIEDSSNKPPEQPGNNFATALEMLAVKAFGDMGQTARLRLIRHLDSTPPETPIRDVVDRCRVWESHADPAISRTRKPTPDPMYLTFAVGESDSNNETTRVAVVTEPKSDEHKLMEMIRRILSNTMHSDNGSDSLRGCDNSVETGRN